MKKITPILVYCSIIAYFVISGCTSNSTENKVVQPSEKVLYQCPMDCESGKTYPQKTTCPVCEMDLEKAENPV